MRALGKPFFAFSALAACLATAPLPAMAQPAAGDPPARLGRLAVLQGTVSFHTVGEDHWDPATLNYPVTSGNAFWTEPQAQAAFQVAASSVWLNSATELDVSTLDDRSVQATAPEGELYLHLRGLRSGETYTVQTPRGLVTITANGRYDIVAGDTQNPTTLSVLEGTAQLTGNNISLAVNAGQTASVTGTDTFQGSVGPLIGDAFQAAMAQREQPPAAVLARAPAVVQRMTGCEDLSAIGIWQPAPEYGEVWYPPVPAGWVPYREGHWAYVAPWGWTWVDDAPWGFAPFHYGRWIEISDRWGWVPADPQAPVVVEPVYAPALVSFFGLGAAAARVVVAPGLGRGAAFSGGNIGWVPLGPREPYYPPYRASPAYLRQVNVVNVTNVTTTVNIDNRTLNRFANTGAATVVPASAMAASRPIRGAVQAVTPAQLAQVRPVLNRAPIAPTPETAGVTPGVARQLHFSAGPAARPAAPGPAVAPTAFQRAPTRLPLAPALRNAQAPGAVGGAAAGGTSPRPEEARPGQPSPELRPGEPGSRQGGAPGPEARPGSPAPEIRGGEVGRGGVPPLAPAGAAPGPTGARPETAAPGRAPAPPAHPPEARPGPETLARPAPAAPPRPDVQPGPAPHLAPSRAEPPAHAVSPPPRSEPPHAAPPPAPRPAPPPPAPRVEPHAPPPPAPRPAPPPPRAEPPHGPPPQAHAAPGPRPGGRPEEEKRPQ
ncbi:MAG: hypothetical protein JO264_03440 [Acidisphaera sp.]|nr:hypothetical protein [Acidisphaera sp.]